MLATAVLVIAIILFIKYPTFRKITGIAAVAAIVCILLIYGYVKEEAAGEARKREAAKHLVPPTSLGFDEMQLGTEYGSFRLTGRVKNNSQHTITAITVKLAISDCDASGHCDVVGDKEQECFLKIPPGEVRDIDETLFMEKGTKIRNTLEWNYTIPYVSAEQ